MLLRGVGNFLNSNTPTTTTTMIDIPTTTLVIMRGCSRSSGNHHNEILGLSRTRSTFTRGGAGLRSTATTPLAIDELLYMMPPPAWGLEEILLCISSCTDASCEGCVVVVVGEAVASHYGCQLPRAQPPSRPPSRAERNIINDPMINIITQN